MDFVRNWLDLPTEVMSLIFLKLNTIDILLRAQWVCSTWQKISKQPQFYRIIDTRSSRDLCSEGMVREAVERSCGQLAEISVAHFATDELLQFISEKSTSLRCLRLVYCKSLTDNGFIEMVKKTPQLEELEICHCSFTRIPMHVFLDGGPLFPQLKSFRLNYVDDYWYPYLVTQAIAKNMHELRHLDLSANKMHDDQLRAILDGCPHLKSLDLRRCFNLKFGGDLKERTANIKIRHPHDPIDDDEYDIHDPTDDYEYDIDDPTDKEDCDFNFTCELNVGELLSYLSMKKS